MAAGPGLHELVRPDRALVFRIVHRRNVPWILDHGILCRTAPGRDAGFVSIGHPDVIEKRARRTVPDTDGRTLADFVPFYLTPSSIMLFNLETGRSGVRRQDSRDIVFLVSSLDRLRGAGRPVLVTDGHALAAQTRFSAAADGLTTVDWALLQARDFRHDPDDPGRGVRYQAEVLVREKVDIDTLLGLACYDAAIREEMEAALRQRRLDLPVAVRQRWYFR